MKPRAKILAITLLFVGLILVNYLASAIPLRIDATAESIYSLSDGTKAMLGKIEEPVTLDLYFSEDADALPILPLGNTGTHFIDDAHDFVSWSAGILNARPQAFFRERVAMADATGLHLDSHVSRAGLRNFTLYDLEIRSRCRNLRRLHRRYRCCRA